ncbi:MAG: hypothetical protein U0703_11880 [Anaerolineae bacterium]
MMPDGWTPHFTLLMPYTGSLHRGNALRAAELFSADPILSVESVCLLVRLDGETHYRLHREFPLHVVQSESP